jgi:hypothetical protein
MPTDIRVYYDATIAVALAAIFATSIAVVAAVIAGGDALNKFASGVPARRSGSSSARRWGSVWARNWTRRWPCRPTRRPRRGSIRERVRTGLAAARARGLGRNVRLSKNMLVEIVRHGATA